jgi:hypothetical protein
VKFTAVKAFAVPATIAIFAIDPVALTPVAVLLSKITM